MQKLLLELGAPLVFAFVLLAIAKLIRGLIQRYRKPREAATEDDPSIDDHSTDEQRTD
jgi:hypothetical protein